MKNWNEVKDCIMPNWNCEYDKKEKIIFIRATNSMETRKQTILIQNIEQYVCFSSKIGCIGKNQIKEALNDLAGIEYGRMICDSEGNCFIQYIDEIQYLTEQKIQTIIKQVLGSADSFEEKYIGKDIF